MNKFKFDTYNTVNHSITIVHQSRLTHLPAIFLMHFPRYNFYFSLIRLLVITKGLLQYIHWEFS